LAFPTSAIYDTCVRADEAPLATASGGSSWATISDIGSAGITACQILSNKIAPQSSVSNQYLNVVDGADCEHYCTVGTLVTEIDLIIRMKDVASIFTIDGYGLQVIAAANVFRLVRFDNVVVTVLATFTQAVAGNDGIGISVIGSTLTAWFRSGLGGSWTSIGTASDATYAAGGYKGITLNGSLSRLFDMGGGSVVAGSGNVKNQVPLDGMGTYYRGLA
jgi:hypothetical protein